METLLDITEIKLEPLKFGPFVFPVLRADQKKNGKTYEGFRFKITWDKKVYERRRNTLEELKTEAARLVKAWNMGGFSNQETIVLNSDDAERWRKFQELEKIFGRSLINFFTDEVAPATKALAPFKVSILRAAQDYATRHTGCRPITVSGAVGLFLREKQYGGTDCRPISKEQFKRYRSILGYLSDKYGHKQITELTPIRVKAFLHGLTRQKKFKARLRTAKQQAERT
jgi:hypothetical protein